MSNEHVHPTFQPILQAIGPRYEAVEVAAARAAASMGTFKQAAALLKTWVRHPGGDRRIAHGDDFAADAWRNAATGEVKLVVVGHSPEAIADLEQDRAALLEALREIFEECRAVGSPSLGALARAQAAIAKAEGSSNG